MLPTLQQYTRCPSLGPAAQQWLLLMCLGRCMCGHVPQEHSCRPLCHLTQQNRDQQLSCLRPAPRLLPHGRLLLLLLLRHLGRVTGALG
jgi:hypothetical protein